MKLDNAKKTILYVCTEDWYFHNHRLAHAEALVDAGFDVHLATRSGPLVPELVDAGCKVHPLEISRDASIPQLLRESLALFKIMRKSQADLVHFVALKPVLLGLILFCMRPRTRFVFAVSGLGVSGVKQSRGLVILSNGLRFASKSKRCLVLFQNPDDRASVGADERRTALIPGVGVDVDEFDFVPPPPRPPTVVTYLGRPVRSKGLSLIGEAAEANQIPNLEFHLYLADDPSSPGALSADEIATLAAAKGVSILPETQDPRKALEASNAAILPSLGGEGVSKFMLEALAMGRPVVASNTSGNTSVLEEGVTGFLFEAGSATDLVRALKLLDAANHRRMGEAARDNAESFFDLRVIAPQIVEMHQSHLM